MTIGISLQALGQVVGIAKSIGNPMLLFPLNGTIGKLELDTSKSKKKAGQLANQLLDNLPKDIRGAAKKIAGVEDEEEIPPPTTQPLPWEKN